MQNKKILICGAGSIGIYLGVNLNSKNHDVKLFGRRKLKEIGEEIFIKDKKFKVPEKIFHLPRNEKFDFIFITTKLYDLEKMVKLIRKNNVKGKLFAGIYNGLVDTSKYSKILNQKIIPITVFSGFGLSGNKLIVNPTPMGWVTENSSDGKKVSRLLLDANVPCKSNKNFDFLRAEKTIVNCCLNALSAIENKPFCDLFKNKKTRERIEKLFEECYNILSKQYKLKRKDKIKKRMFENWKNLKHYSSTCQDIRSGRKNEVKFFNGYIVELGKKYKIPAENNKKIMKEINLLAKKN